MLGLGSSPRFRVYLEATCGGANLAMLYSGRKKSHSHRELANVSGMRNLVEHRAIAGVYLFSSLFSLCGPVYACLYKIIFLGKKENWQK